MCLFEKKIANLKYLPNQKNCGLPPAALDKRVLHLNVGCGWCKECRTRVANDWRVRLYEERKANKRVEFVTLSFSPEAIRELKDYVIERGFRGLQGDEVDVNLLAAAAIRLWSERWRKFEKKAPRHWLITELGKTNSERIHLHGLIWDTDGHRIGYFRNLIKSTWKYGNVYIGDYVNERTINYIMKYVTKLDASHDGYKQKIFVSKRLGADYVEKNRWRHLYNGANTRKNYITYNGIKLGLPRYFKEKLWNDEQREELWRYEMDKNKIYVDGNEYSTLDNDNIFQMALKAARESNNLAGFGSNKTVNRKYIITDAMMANYSDLKKMRLNRMVKSVPYRYVEKTVNYEQSRFSKEAVEQNWYGEYCGSTTEAQRNYNELLGESRIRNIPIRVLRMEKKGLLNNVKYFEDV